MRHFVFYFRSMMKRMASLFLLATLFYNVLGYYLLHHQQEEQKWVATMEDREPSEYKVIKMNASVYSFVQDTDFEYVNQNVEINNKFYHIFKKRIQNNILYLYYLPNSHQDKISKNLNNIVDQQLFDHSPTKESPTKKLLKTFISDYVVTKPIIINVPTYLFSETDTQQQTQNARPLCGYFNTPFSPPDLV